MKSKILICKEVNIETCSEQIHYDDAYNLMYSKAGRKFGWKKIWENYINYWYSIGEFETALEEDNKILHKLLKMKNRKLTFSFKEINLIIRSKNEYY